MKMVVPLEVGICCRDMEGLARFYVEMLRCAPINIIEVGADKARVARLSGGAYRVARLQTPWGERIKLLQPATPPAQAEPTEWILGRQGAAYLTFIVDDLAAVVGRLRSGRVELMTGNDPVEIRPGVWLAFARDPEGNTLEFVEYEALSEYREDAAPAATRVR
jgi:catechol 2,3-dioxygenase-like lactoylglutathione lyase family enzyme